MKRFLPVLAVLLLTVACSIEELSSLTHEVSFTAEESDTRTSMTDKGDYYSFSWDGSDLRRLHVTESGNSYECEDIIEDGLDYPAMYRASL